MRGSNLVIFFRLIGAAGLGSYAGAAAAGLISVVTGRALVASSPWLGALPVLAPLGAALIAVAAMLTRKWLFPKLTRRRTLWAAAAGAVLTPLAMAVGYLGDLLPVALLLMAAGWLTAAITWVRWFRASRNGTVTPAPRRPGVDHPATAVRR